MPVGEHHLLCMPRIIRPIIAVHISAANSQLTLTAPAATSTMAMTNIGMQQAIIIQP